MEAVEEKEIESEYTRKLMNKLDCCLIRYKRKTDLLWRYEICTDDDLYHYADTKDQYEYCSPEVREWSNSFDFEILPHTGINISDDLCKLLNIEKE